MFKNKKRDKNKYFTKTQNGEIANFILLKKVKIKEKIKHAFSK